ncbi:redoxin domain-containing protein [Cohnella sp. CFH 77786]|uniref:glutathione peroxidase n=1 Tax=Cohnella sp. CFH 77786 TaxID=2662265 RepID=UPI001C60B0CC|nr:glutathione peroxidase [Cohnella sp. CFH 77786]MBW5446718.1 redoxin domain-containing protein [Cohnella sp. CFH 77786]
MSIYDFKTRRLNGQETDLSPYRGKVLLIVNTASQCGLTPQYEGLQKLYDEYREQGLEILGFPCNQFGAQEPGTHEEIGEFCKINYGVTFPLFEKTVVNGPDAHPLYKYLKEQAPFQGEPAGSDDEIKWNFTKFLIGRDGSVVRRFEPSAAPAELEPAIRELL